jgi:hypothetical protein
VPYTALNVPDPIAVAVDAMGPGQFWLRPLVKLGAVAGLTSVIMVRGWSSVIMVRGWSSVIMVRGWSSVIMVRGWSSVIVVRGWGHQGAD